MIHLVGMSSSHARQVVGTTQSYITAMDALKLGQKAVDEVQPVIADLVSTLNRCDKVADDFVGLEKARSWLVTLNGMRASDELVDDQIRQLCMTWTTHTSPFSSYLKGEQRSRRLFRANFGWGS